MVTLHAPGLKESLPSVLVSLCQEVGSAINNCRQKIHLGYLILGQSPGCDQSHSAPCICAQIVDRPCTLSLSPAARDC